MNKQDFLAELEGRLRALPKAELDRSLEFYGELIDDCIEDGMTEDEAVATLDPDVVAREVICDTPLSVLVKSRAPKKGLSVLNIILLVIGFPLWFSILAALSAVVLAVYVTIWSVAVALWAALAGIAIGGIACLLASPFAAIGFGAFGVLAALGCGLALIGLAIFAFFGVLAVTKGIIKLSALIIRAIKSGFVSKKEAIAHE